jgi:hypothetical protein
MVFRGSSLQVLYDADAYDEIPKKNKGRKRVLWWANIKAYPPPTIGFARGLREADSRT